MPSGLLVGHKILDTRQASKAMFDMKYNSLHVTEALALKVILFLSV
jgi:hypothetical protein